MNGAIHHLDDKTVVNTNKFVDEFKESIFLSVDPIYDNNKIVNTIMLKLDRGKYIRTKNEYKLSHLDGSIPTSVHFSGLSP